MKRVADITFMILLTLTGVALVWYFRQVLGLFAFMLILAAATRPLVEFFDLKRINRSLAMILIYVALIALIVLIFVGVSDSLFNDLQLLSDRAAFAYENVFNTWPDGSDFQKTIAARLPPPANLYESMAGENGLGFAQVLLGVTVNSFSFIAQLFIAIILSIYWSVDSMRFERLWLSLLPPDSRTRARNIWRDIERGVGVYLQNEFVRGLLAGLLTGFGLALIGVPYASLLGVIAGLTALIPWLGIMLAVVPVLLAGLSVGPLFAVAGVVYTLAVFIFIEGVIQRRIFGAQNYSSILTLLIALALVEIFGIFGLLLAPPLSATIQLFFRSMQNPAKRTVDESKAGKLAEMKSRISVLNASILASDDDVSRQASSILVRLEGLIKKVEELVE